MNILWPILTFMVGVGLSWFLFRGDIIFSRDYDWVTRSVRSQHELQQFLENIAGDESKNRQWELAFRRWVSRELDPARFRSFWESLHQAFTDRPNLQVMFMATWDKLSEAAYNNAASSNDMLNVCLNSPPNFLEEEALGKLRRRLGGTYSDFSRIARLRHDHELMRIKAAIIAIEMAKSVDEVEAVWNFLGGYNLTEAWLRKAQLEESREGLSTILVEAPVGSLGWNEALSKLHAMGAPKLEAVG